MAEIQVDASPTELVLNVGEGVPSDLFGVNVYVTRKGLEGWYGGGVAVRRKEQDRLWAHGKFSLPGTRDGRLVTITGVAWGDSRRAAGELADLLNSVMAEGTVGKITVNDPDVGTRWAKCYLTGTPEVDWDWDDTLTWTIDLVCPNPRKFGFEATYDTGITEGGGGLMWPLFAGEPLTLERTNLAINPALQTGTTGYAAGTGTGGAATVSRPTTGGTKGAAHYRQTWTTAGTGGSAGVIYTENTLTGGVGDPLSASIWVRTSVAKSMALLARFRNSTTAQTGTGAVTSAYQTVPANTWTELKAEGAISTGTYTNVQVYPLIANTVTNAVGQTLDVDGLMIERRAGIGDYFDGDTLLGDGFSYSWNGTPHASTSSNWFVGGAGGILDFGFQGRMGTVVFNNIGTADTYPEFWVRGYTPYFTITELETGRQLQFVGEVPQFQTLFLNASNGAVYLDSPAANRLTGLGRDEWPVIPPKSTRTYLFDSPEGPNARLFFKAAPAWW